MADSDHLKVLARGREAWNEWRSQHPEVEPDLRDAELVTASLRGFNFGHTFLDRAKLNGADLQQADLRKASLFEARLEGANLGGVILGGANLARAALDDANLLGARLGSAKLRNATLARVDLRASRLPNADLTGANLTGADLSSSRLQSTNFRAAKLKGARLNRTVADGTLFIDLDLSDVEGLEEVMHRGPSVISVSTIHLSAGRIPERFLRGCGVPEPFIVHIPALVAAIQPIQFYSCFISYSSRDEELARRLYADLQTEGVRCWFAPEDLKIGDRFRRRIDEVIRVYDRLLLLLSEHSVASSWVEKEVETAMESEDDQQRTVLFPVRLDDAVMEIKVGWPADVRRTRHIGDFRRWKEHDEYRKAFERLLSDLKAGA